MFEKVSQMAEQAATNVSRRQFLGRFGRGAMVVAAAAGGLLAYPGGALAGRKRCSSDADCHNGQICGGVGHCIDPPIVCDAGSVPECVGFAVGQACGTFGYGGYCFAVAGSSCACGTSKPGKGNGR